MIDSRAVKPRRRAGALPGQGAIGDASFDDGDQRVDDGGLELGLTSPEAR